LPSIALLAGQGNLLKRFSLGAEPLQPLPVLSSDPTLVGFILKEFLSGRASRVLGRARLSGFSVRLGTARHL